MRKLFGKIWLIWSAFIFIASWPVVWLSYKSVYTFAKPKNQLRKSFKVTQIWGNYVLFMLGVKTNFKGRENVDPTSQYVFVSNHLSQIDIPLNFSSSPMPFVILSKIEATKIPVVGTHLKYSHVTVDRKKKEDRKNSMDKLAQHLQEGTSILLYPEGRRNQTDNFLGEFKAGAFLLAIQNQVPILPVTIIGSDKINNPKDPYSLFPGKVSVFYDKPISTKGLTNKDMNELMEETRAKMLLNFV